MTQRDEGHNFRDSKNKAEQYEKNQKVKRIELGEVMYQFEEIFDTPKEALNKDKQGDEPKFIVLEKKVQQVNIKPIEKDKDIELRRKENVQSTENPTIETSTKLGSEKDE